MKNSEPKIKYADLYGLRKEKYEFLKSHNVKSTKWQNLKLKEPFCFFVPKDFSLEKKYNKFINFNDIFIKTSSGIKTHRDHFVIGFTDEEIKSRIFTFISDLDDKFISDALKIKDTRDWKLNTARESLKKIGIKENKLYSYLWRPFDFRRIYYSEILIELPRTEVVGHLINNNLALCLSRKIDKPIWDDVLATNLLADVHSASGQTYVFPLYLYNQNNYTAPKTEKKNLSYGAMMLFDAPAKPAKQSNIKKEILELLKVKYKQNIKPEKIFNYVYAILYSNKYREKYQEFLKIDFPRVPFTKDYKLFKEFGKLGKELIDLHLLKSKKLNKTTTKFCGTGLNEVKKREYIKKEKKLFINDKQYFAGIEPEIWEYYIGGYPVLDKWIKDRAGKNLTRKEVEHYLKMITSLQNTIELQKKIDKLYIKVEKSLLKC